jgi:hypothetical protein
LNFSGDKNRIPAPDDHALLRGADAAGHDRLAQHRQLEKLPLHLAIAEDVRQRGPVDDERQVVRSKVLERRRVRLRKIS